MSTFSNNEPWLNWTIFLMASSIVMQCNNYSHTVQLKGNLIPTCMLQFENSQLKIASYIQFLNWCPLHSCTYPANRQACAPVNVTLTLNELLMKLTINSVNTMSCMCQSILESIDLLKSCSRAVMCSQYLTPYCLV